MPIPNRSFVATATGNFQDILANTGPYSFNGWYISETAGATAGAQLLDGFVAAPGAATATLVATSGGALSNGAYTYKVTYVTSTGETDPSVASNSVTVDGTHNQITVSAIPLFAGSLPGTRQRVTARKLYRTVAAGGTWKLVTTFNDNTTTTYLDNIADGALGANAPSANTTGFVVAQFDLAAKESRTDSFDIVEATYPGVPPRLNITSGAVRMTLFGR